MSSRYKVYIVDEAHMVSTQGFNALLKLVEEPPEFLVFVFATTEPDKVLSTIRSRTHHYPFRLIPPGVMRGLLSSICTAEGVASSRPCFPLVVRAGGGSARDSLSVLDQLIAGSGPDGVTYATAVGLLGVTDGALLDEIVDALAAGDAAAVYATVDRVVEAGHDPRRFAADLLERLRDLIVLDAVPDAVGKGLLDCPPDQVERMTDQAARLGTATLSRLADIVHTGLIEMRGTTSPRLLLELVSARMLLPAASTDGPALLQRLERMERRLAVSSAPVGEDVGAPPEPARPARPARPGSGEPAPGDPDPEGAGGRPTSGPADGPRAERAGERGASGGTDGRDRPPGGGSGAAARGASGEGVPAASASDRPPAPAARAGRSGAAAADGAAADPSGAGASPAAATTPTPAVGPVDATAVRRVWPEVLDAAKRRSRTAHALLMNASVRSVDQGVLTLATSTQPLYRLLTQDVNRDVVRAALRDVLGVDWRIHVAVDGGPAVGGAESGPADPSPEEDPRDDEPSPPPAAAGAAPARPTRRRRRSPCWSRRWARRRVQDRGP